MCISLQAIISCYLHVTDIQNVGQNQNVLQSVGTNLSDSDMPTATSDILSSDDNTGMHEQLTIGKGWQG